MDGCHLVVGLGNPGRAYAETRHNAGFLLAERLAGEAGGVWDRQSRFQARVARCHLAGRTCLIAEPLTFMNASGEAVRALVAYHRIPLDRLLVLVDDADLCLGRLRLRPDGSAGGHHGLESIERMLGTREYARLRLGIGREERNSRELTGHVLGAFEAGERPLLERVLERAAQQVKCWLTEGVRPAMDRFNGLVETLED